MNDPISYLRHALARGTLVPFVGAGVSKAAANLPTWAELLDRGIEYAHVNFGVHADDNTLTTIQQAVVGGDLIGAFGLLEQLYSERATEGTPLGIESFIAEVFGNPNLEDSTVLDALAYLGIPCAVTTNYDDLLEQRGVGGGRAVTWKQFQAARDMFRTGTGVLHLHGRWDQYDSVILTKRSYTRILESKPAARIAQVIFHGKVLLFVGTSLDGVHDPHLSDLLEEFQGLAALSDSSNSPHILLKCGAVTGDEQARLHKLGITPVSYGESFEVLPEFIRSIVAGVEVHLRVQGFADLLDAVTRVSDLGAGLSLIANWMRDVIFGGRQVRIAFYEKARVGDHYELRRRAVIPASSTGNPHGYPLSISGWALVEGKPICWPHDKERAANFRWLRRINKYDEISQLIQNLNTETSPELYNYADVEGIKHAAESETLLLSDFFQDWVSDLDTPTYSQFISIPVPWLGAVGTRYNAEEYGVFNIDSLDSEPLMTRQVENLLRLAAGVATAAYRAASRRRQI